MSAKSLETKQAKCHHTILFYTTMEWIFHKYECWHVLLKNYLTINTTIYTSQDVGCLKHKPSSYSRATI